ncbi:glycosyltransferase family 4 protein [Faunimonas pinastri]|nr:glycosyltransferase family 4 protein [Faunimonas pinastri]
MRFSPHGATSIDLCIHDFVRFSRYREQSTVIAGWVEEPFQDVNTKLIMREAAGFRERAREIRKIIRAEKPDLVVVHQHLPTAAILGRSRLGCPVLFHIHNFQKPPRHLLSRWERLRRYRSLDAVICVSEAVREAFNNQWPMVDTPTYTAHNGIDCAGWSADLSDKEKLILFSGRFVREKGVVEAVDALRKVLPDHPDWRAVFLLSSTDEQPDYVQEVREHLRNFGPQLLALENVPHEEVRDWNRRAAIALVPSVFAEPFGRVAIESMAARCALVVTRRGGLPEVVGDTALLVDDPATPDLAIAIDRLLKDETLRVSLAEQGYRRCNERFDIRAVTGHLDDLYDRILGGSPKLR